MVDDRRDTVVVEKDSGSPLGWIIGLVIFLVLVALFFMYGGANIFNGGGTPSGTDTINVQTPDVNVQPSSGTGQ